MNRQTVRCTFCQSPIQMSEQVMKQAIQPLCTTCVELTKTFDHRHTLSMDLFSLEDVNALTAELFRVCVPTAYTCTSFHSSFPRSDLYEVAYWFSCTYELISLELLNMLASLRVRFTLRDMVAQQESLHFWPGDAVTQGVLMPFVIRATRTSAHS